ncbi:transglycosylase domain-containing protein [Kineococcus glutinatus]|uniref:transglycosylase domain-containing protein n=1 Tax=Kineococcus glutinatus TaxID=1070872 RepID=UPI0031F00803
MAARRRPTTRRPRRARRPRRLLGWLFGIAGAGVVLAVGGFAAAYALTTVPDPNELADAQVSTVYYRDGTTPIGRFSARNRVNVTIDQVPLVVQHAVLAAEDRSFYENRGVSPTGIARALWNNVRGGDTQGGSTITQQYVKNYFLSSERSYRRKAEEFFLALKIDQQQTKDETLVAYLNTIYFGRDAYGIQTAAQAYFGKDVSQLDASEGALLAGMLAAPSAYDPRVNAEAAQQRWDYVMDGMVAEGWLTAEERAAAQLPATVEPTRTNDHAGTNGYLLTVVRSELRATVGLTDAEIDRGGYKIVTTFDAAAQAASVAAVQDGLPGEVPDGLQVALVSIDPGDGGVRAMYGGADYLTRARNAATQDTAQAGSTFKPFTLVAALEQGISLRSTYSGSSPMRLDSWGSDTVDNFGGSSYGRIDLLTATANSVNTVYAQLNEDVGPQTSAEVAVRAGYPQDTAGLDDNPSNVLGTSSPHPVDVAEAYATFAAQGVRTQWHTVASLADSTGATTYTASPSQERVFDEDVMADATYAMQQVVQRGSGSYASRLGRDAAGKTGTSSNNLSAWFAGYTPQLSTVVAMYQVGADGSPQQLELGGREVTGGSYPVRIWTSYMSSALEGQPELEFPDPAFVGSGRGGGGGSTATSTSSASASSSGTATPSASATSPTPSASETSTASPTATGTATATPSATPSTGSSGTASPTGSSQPTSQPTSEPAAPSATATSAPEEAAGAGATASAAAGAEAEESLR